YWFVELKPVEITAISLLLVLPPALIYLFAGTSFSFKITHHEGALEALGYVTILGVLGTALPLIMFNGLVRLATPIVCSSMDYVIPVVAVCGGVWDGDTLVLRHYVGMVATLLGGCIGNSKDKQSP